MDKNDPRWAAFERARYYVFACVTKTHIYTQFLKEAAFIVWSIRARESDVHPSREKE